MARADLSSRLEEVVASVLRSLELQDTTTPPFMFFTCGLPGTGKTTFSRALAIRTGAAVLESDRIRSLMYPRPTFRPSESMFLFATIHLAAGALLQRGQSVIVDATSLTQSERQPLHKIAEAARVPLYVATFEAPEAVIQERLRRRKLCPNANDYSQAGIEVYDQMKQRFRPVTSAHWSVDSTDPHSFERALTEIAALVRAANDGGGERL